MKKFLVKDLDGKFQLVETNYPSDDFQAMLDCIESGQREGTDGFTLKSKLFSLGYFATCVNVVNMTAEQELLQIYHGQGGW